MDPNRWERAKTLFHDVLELSPERRQPYLQGACREDEGLQREVEELLRAHDRLGPWLASPTLGSGAHGSRPGASTLSDSEQAGTRIGRYKLLERIGEGGFGEVWMAEQEAPVRRQVALKVIKLGMDTRHVVARFEQEREALALMEHPNIAKVLDGGATESGRPYFVMELVRGLPITSFCDQEELSIADRLSLFQQVCNAVQHAHQKGIIHRDLKPSNVLVTLHDGRPVPKVIDFGIAKATDAELTQRTLFTGFRQLIGTPEYMAPEQGGLSGLDVDTRADIYSLGVLLYELLTGTRPHEMRAAMERGYDEILRTIREDEPPKPSTRASTLGDRLTDVARRRHTAPKTLSRLIRGDLDWIVLKALEKDRSRRYATAYALSEDIGRHLADQPVLATPPSGLYRLVKYTRRHRLGVGAAAAILLALISGLAVAWAGYAEADHARLDEMSERQRAERHAAEALTEAARAKQVIALTQQLLASADPYERKGKDYTVRQLLDEFDAGLGESLGDQPEVEATIRATMGATYRSLGLYDQAEPHLARALELRRGAFGDADEETLASLREWGEMLRNRGRYEDAARTFREVIATERSNGAENDTLVYALASLAGALMERGHLEGAEEAARESLSLARRLHGDDDLIVARCLGELSGVLQDKGDLAAAESPLREALAIRRRLEGDPDPSTVSDLNNLGLLLRKRGDYRGAEESYRESLALGREVFGDDHPDVAAALGNLGALFWTQGKHELAEPFFQEALDMQRKHFGPRHPNVATTMSNLANLLNKKGDRRTAEPLLREALSIFRENGDETLALVANLYNLAVMLGDKPDYEEAASLLREAIEVLHRFSGQGATLAKVLLELAWVLEAQGDLDRAAPVRREVLALQREWLGTDHLDVASTLGALATLQEKRRDYADAERLHRQAYEIRRKLSGEDDAQTMQELVKIAFCRFSQGDFAESERLQRQAIESFSRTIGPDAPQTAALTIELGCSLQRQAKFAEAEQVVRHCYEVQRSLRGPEPKEVAGAAALLGSILCDQGRQAEAEPFLREAVDRLPSYYSEEQPLRVRTASLLLDCLEARQDHHGSIELAFANLESARRRLPADSLELAEHLGRLGRILVWSGESAEAEPILRECFAVRQATEPQAWTTFQAMSLLGEALTNLGRFEEAEPLLLEGFEKMDPPLEKSIQGREALERLVALYVAWDESAPGTDKAEAAAAWRTRLAQVSTPEKR
jgi:serine/threonine protein kinase/tetratricopeptide (TPR) repeat protein